MSGAIVNVEASRLVVAPSEHRDAVTAADTSIERTLRGTSPPGNVSGRDLDRDEGGLAQNGERDDATGRDDEDGRLAAKLRRAPPQAVALGQVLAPELTIARGDPHGLAGRIEHGLQDILPQRGRGPPLGRRVPPFPREGMRGGGRSG